MDFTNIWYSYNRSWSQISASFIQGQSANSRKDNDLRSLIQSREDALREVEKLVKHAESLERKYNEKVWLKKFLSSYRQRCFTIPLFEQAVFMMALLYFDCQNSQIQWGRGKMQAERWFLVLQTLLLVRYYFVMCVLFSVVWVYYHSYCSFDDSTHPKLIHKFS